MQLQGVTIATPQRSFNRSIAQGSFLTTQNKVIGPATVSYSIGDIVIPINATTGQLTINLPPGVDGAVVKVVSIEGNSFPGTDVVINPTLGQKIVNPLTPSAPVGTSTVANFVGGTYNEAYEWVFSSSLNTWLLTGGYREVNVSNFSVTQEYTVASNSTVAANQVISLDPTTGNALPGYTFPGSTSLPNELFGMNRYFVLDPNNMIAVGYTDTYSVLIKAVDDGVTRPVFGTPLYYNYLTAGDRAVRGIRLSDDTYAIAFTNSSGSDLKVIAIRTNDQTITHPPDAQSLPLSATYTDIVESGPKLFCQGNIPGTGDMVLGFTDSSSPNGGRDLVLQVFYSTMSGTPPVLTNSPPFVTYEVTGSGNIVSGSAEFYPPSRVGTLLINEDGSQDIVYIRRDLTVFTVLDSKVLTFTEPSEFGVLSEIAAGILVVVGPTSGRYKTYNRSGDILTEVVNQDPIFNLPLGNSYTGDLQVSRLPASGRFIATGTMNGDTGAIAYGLLSGSSINWSVPIYNSLPRLGMSAYISLRSVIAAVSYENGNGVTITGLTSFYVDTPTSTLTPYRFEGPYPVGISTQAGSAGDTIVATVAGIHDMGAPLLVPGQMYFADTDGNIRQIPLSDNVQFKIASKLGVSISPSKIQFKSPSEQSVDY